MYNPHLGETVKYVADSKTGLVKEAVVVRINAKTISLSNMWRVSPIFILNPMEDEATELKNVLAFLNGTNVNFVVGDRVQFMYDKSQFAGRIGTVVKKNAKSYKVSLDSLPGSKYKDMVTTHPSFITKIGA